MLRTLTQTLCPVVPFLIALCACSDDGPPDGGEPDAMNAPDAAMNTPDAVPVPDATTIDADLTGAELPPEVTIAFPTPVSYTDSQLLTVRGTASDVTAVAEVRVAGVPATTVDGFANWTAEVTLQPGTNLLVVEAEDDWGNVDTNAASLSVAYQSVKPGTPGRIAWDAVGDRLLVADWGIDAVFSVDRTTGAMSPLSSASVGDGPSLSAPIGIESGPAAGHALVLDAFARALFDIDLATGDRTVVSALDDPASGSVISAKYLTLQTPQRALLSTSTQVYAVDLTTGMRTLVASNSVGKGPAFGTLSGMVYHPTRARVFIGNHVSKPGMNVVSVDPVSGDRTIISGPGVGTGPLFEDIEELAVDEAGDRLFVTDMDIDTIFAIDLTTGDRTIVASSSVGAGAGLRLTSGIAFAATTGRLMAADRIVETFYEIDPAVGDRTILASTRIGQGMDLRGTVEVRWDVPAQRVFAITNKTVFEISLTTGDRRTIAANIAGIGEPEWGLMSLAPDLANNQLYVYNYRENLLENLYQLFAVDIETGTLSEFPAELRWLGSAYLTYDPTIGLLGTKRSRSKVSRLDWATGDATLLSSHADPMLGSGPEISLITDVALDVAHNRLLLAKPDDYTLYAIDLSTGDRSIMASPDMGEHDGLLFHPIDITIDTDDERLVVTNDIGGTLMSVDPATGDRKLLADASNRGPTIQFGPAIDIDPALDRVVLADQDGSALFLVDLHTGERVIIAR